MKISIIGAGNIAHLIAHSYLAKGHQIVEICNRSIDKGKEFAEKSGARFVEKPELLSPETDAVFIAVQDNVIEKTINEIRLENKFLIHCSGTMVLNPGHKTINHYGVIWPLYSINQDQLPIESDIPLIIDADQPGDLNKIRQFASVISENMIEMDFQKRQKMHLAAVVSNNFTNHLLGVLEDYMNKENLPAALLQPILKQTFENAIHHSALNSQTGPAIRRDSKTIEQHLLLLEKFPDLKELYLRLSQSIQNFHPQNRQSS